MVPRDLPYSLLQAVVAARVQTPDPVDPVDPVVQAGVCWDLVPLKILNNGTVRYKLTDTSECEKNVGKGYLLKETFVPTMCQGKYRKPQQECHSCHLDQRSAV